MNAILEAHMDASLERWLAKKSVNYRRHLSRVIAELNCHLDQDRHRADATPKPELSNPSSGPTE